MASIVEIIVRTIDESTGANGVIKGSFTELKSAIELGKQALEMIGSVYEGTIGKATEYAASVRQVSLVSGMSVEQSSRMVEVADKLGVSLGGLQQAFRFMAKNGIDPSLDSLAMLSDKYIALKDPVQQDQFLLENFGRSGLNMAFMMSQGSDALRTLSEETNKNLILNQKQIDAAHANSIATKELKESWEAFTIGIGNSAIPTVTKLINSQLDLAAAQDLARSRGDNNLSAIHMQQAGYMQEALAIREATQAGSANSDMLDANSRAAHNNTLAVQTQAAAQETVKQNYSAQIGLVGSMQSAETSYETQAMRLTQERTKLESERALKLAQGYSTQGATIKNLDAQLQANADASAANAKQHDIDSKKIILGYMEQQLAADGLTKAEMNFLLMKGKEWGVYSDSVVSDTLKAEAEVQGYIDTLNSIPGHINTILDLQQVYGENARISGSGIKRAMGGLTGMAGGGRVKVGEWGPEYVDLPPGANVHTAGDTAAMDKGKKPALVIQINLNGVVTDPQMAARALAPTIHEFLRKEGWE